MSERDRFVACAKAQVGKSYVWATAGPNTFDCSGLVSFCYQEATGKAISRSSHDQFRFGVAMPIEQVSPGDVLFYDTMGDGAGHVGIKVADDRAVHALNADLGVRETRIAGAQLGGPFIGARRLPFNDSLNIPPNANTPVPKEQKDPKGRKRRHRRKKDGRP